MKKKRLFKKVFVIFLILVCLLIILILVNMKVWKYLDKKDVKIIPILDKCSVLFSNIIHTIKDESSCENSCRAECITREMDFYNSEFYFNEESCNTCNCYCK